MSGAEGGYMDPHYKIEELWRQTAAELAQEPEREPRQAIRERYVRETFMALEGPGGGCVVKKLEDFTRPVEDRFEYRHVKLAFKRLLKRGEIERVERVGDGMLLRLVG